MNMHLPRVCCLALLTPLFLVTQASGAVILWDAAAVNTNTSDASQMSTAGGPTALFAALDVDSAFTSTSYSVNGVTFTATNAHVSIGQDNASNVNGAAPGTQNNNALILRGGAYNADTDSTAHPIQLSGLTAGHVYQLQLWTPYWNANYSTRFSDVAPTGPTFLHALNESPSVNVGDTGNSVTSQYILGTFTADVGGLQSIYYYGDGGYGMFGAMQVRDLGLVPEPSTVALAVLGMSVALFRLRRKQRS